MMVSFLPEVPKVKKVPPEVRRARALRRKATVKPTIEERKKRQKKSQQDREKVAMKMKPGSGHRSARPNRGAKKRAKLSKVRARA